jgi:protein-disulfide isomerase/uncharacterized membrane protein
VKAILLNRVLLVLAFVGLFVAGVLSLEAGLNLEVPCGGGNGCATVAQDPASKVAGIPVAYIGLLGYLILAGLAVMRSLTPIREWRKLVNIGYLVAVVGAGVSLWLQYRSFFVIHATCLWCLTSAVIMVVSLIVYALLAQEMDNVPTTAPSERLEADVPDGEAVPAPVFESAEVPARKLDTALIAALPVALGIGLVIMGLTMKSAGSTGPKIGMSVDKMSMATLVPSGVHSIGPEDAALTIVEFADLCCPACKRVSPQVKEFVKQHPGKVRLVYRNFPLPMHHQAMTAAAIGEVASDEDRFWEYAMAVMALPEEPESPEQLIQIAKSTGVNEKKVRERLKNTDDPVYGRLNRDLQAVKELGITSTPTFFMITNGKVIDVLGPSQIMEQLANAKYQEIVKGGNGG